MRTEWWESYFSGLFLDVLRQGKTEGQTGAEADFIQKVLRLSPRAKILDVPCGNGRLSLELASRGYQVTGVDITLPLLNDARRKAAKQQLEVVWEHRDMRDLPWQEEFDDAFCFWGSFGYFDEIGNRGFLQAVARALQPGARFLLDIHIAESLLPRFQGRDWQRVGDILMFQERCYDHLHSRVDVEMTLVKSGRTTKRASSVRIYTYRQLCQLFEEVGFAICEGYGSLNRESFKFGSQRLYLVAEKKGV